MLALTFNNYGELNHFLKYDKDTLHGAIIENIEIAWDISSEIAYIAKFYVEDDGGGNGMGIHVDISMDKGEWEESLYLALYHFEETEQYEKCLPLIDLIKKITGEFHSN